MIESISVPRSLDFRAAYEWIEINIPGSTLINVTIWNEMNKDTREVTHRAEAMVDFSSPHHRLLFKLALGGS